VVVALVVGVVAMVGVVGLVLWAPNAKPAAAPKQCARPDEIDIYLRDDAELPQVRATVLATHQDVESVVTQTRQQTFEEFQRLFADQPDVLKTARPESLPAVVKVRPRTGFPAGALGDRLAQQFPPPAEIHRLICDELR
jgi:cell division protein FtsX